MSGGGGSLRLGAFRGVLLKPENPYPFLRVIFAENGTHFLGLFLKIQTYFQKFSVFT